VAFATFDAAEVAGLFMTPGVALRSDATPVALTARSDVLNYYQAALNSYRERGCAACQWSDLELTGMGSRSVLAAVTWTLRRHDGSNLANWRQSYCLAGTADGPKIYASATHSAAR
jgi:hypothetical protein